MTQKILSKSKFARLAGVNPSTVTRLCSSLLKSAVVGKQIDAAHPDAVKYLSDKERDQTPPAASGMDPRYEEVVAACQDAQRFSKTFIRKQFGFGDERAIRILTTMRVNGLDTSVNPIPVTMKVPKTPHVRGRAAAKETKKREAVKENEIIEIPDDIQAFGHMTLFDLIDKFGTDGRFVDWLNATQKIEAINEKRLKNATTEGDLVSRTLVRTGIIEPIDACHIKLLTDGAKTIAIRTMAMSSAERPQKDVEKFVADQISSFIRPVKAKVARALKNA